MKKVVSYKRIVSIVLGVIITISALFCVSSCGTNINKLAKKVQGKAYVFDHLDMIITPERDSSLDQPDIKKKIDDAYAGYEAEFKSYTLISDVFGEMSIYANNYCKAHGQINEDKRNVVMTSYSTNLDFKFNKKADKLDAYFDAFKVKPENQHVEFQISFHVYFKLAK